jgi:uncharacterized cupin superfamily protein
MARPKNVVKSSEVPVEELKRGQKFQSLRRRLAAAAGGEKLGCSLWELPPGKAGVPMHAHFANEEAVYVLEGEGTARLGEAEYPIGAGDYVVFRAGEDAHQIVNTSRAPLRFLAMSTMMYPEVATYPESQKVGILGGPPRPDRKHILGVYKFSSSVDYWDGEE